MFQLVAGGGRWGRGGAVSGFDKKRFNFPTKQCMENASFQLRKTKSMLKLFYGFKAFLWFQKLFKNVCVKWFESFKIFFSSFATKPAAFLTWPRDAKLALNNYCIKKHKKKTKTKIIKMKNLPATYQNMKI